MPPIITRFLTGLCLLAFFVQAEKAVAFSGPNNDDCFGAFSVPVSYDPCQLEYVYGTNAGATDSSPYVGQPSDDCGETYKDGDVWFKIEEVPYPGNILIKIKAEEGMQMSLEAYIGYCGNQLFPIGCADLESQSFLLLTDLGRNQTLYIRVWEQKNDAIGHFGIAAQSVPKDIKDLVLCDAGGKYPANQFVLQFEEGTSQEEIREVKQHIILEWGGSLVKECDCGTEPMQLWQVGDPTTLDDVRKSSQQKSGVDTTEYNFIIEDYTTQQVRGQREPFEPKYNPFQPQSSVRVAIIDSGVAPNHNQLQAAFWHNNDASNDCVPSADIGYDFVRSFETPEDFDGHGTGVNGVVILNYPSDIQLELMNLKFFEGDGYLFDAVCAMHFALNKEADILNLSWGFYRSTIPYMLDQVLRRSAKQDVFVVTSSGNDHFDNDAVGRWPSNADYPNVLTVAAIEAFPGADTTLAFYSNYGHETVDLAANGFFSTLAPPNNQTPLAGTSLSAPFVTRTASMMRAYFPQLTAEQTQICLVETAKPVANLAGLLKSEGVLDEEAALKCAQEISASLSVLETSFTASVEADNSVTLQWLRRADAMPVVFSIERSGTGKDWQTIGERAATAGQTHYQFQDRQPQEGLNYYMLRWKDDTGVMQQSAIVSVDIKSPMQILPNPVKNGELYIQLPEAQAMEKISLYDLSGKLVLEQRPSARNTTTVLIPASLSGVYVLHVTTPQTTLIRKLIISD